MVSNKLRTNAFSKIKMARKQIMPLFIDPKYLELRKRVEKIEHHLNLQATP